MFNKLLVLFLLCPMLYGELTPKEELDLIAQYGEQNPCKLSEAFSLLMKGIEEEKFDRAFIAKLEELEKKKFTGHFTENWEDGSRKFSAHFIDGVVDQHVHAWYKSGREAFKGFFFKGTKVTAHMAFADGFRQRATRIIQFNLEGKIHGGQSTCYLSGRKKSFALYENGLINGKEITYGPDSVEIDTLEKRLYEKGKLIKTKIYKPN